MHRFSAMCQKKGISALEKYWDSVLTLLWPRFKTIVQLNIQSIKECDPTKIKTVDQRPHYVRSPFFYLLHSFKSTYVYLPDLQITRRYAEFAAGILSVSQSASASTAGEGESEEGASTSSSPPPTSSISAATDEAVSSLMADMQQEVEHFILKMTSTMQGKKSQLIFLINNYDMVLSILSVGVAR